jgi:hypothetical protein
VIVDQSRKMSEMHMKPACLQLRQSGLGKARRRHLPAPNLSPSMAIVSAPRAPSDTHMSHVCGPRREARTASLNVAVRAPIKSRVLFIK